MNDVTIYHNSACATSRKTLDLLRAHGAAPRVVEYLKTPPDRATLAAMLAHPVLMERPVVVTAKGARIGRPPEAVLEILD